MDWYTTIIRIFTLAEEFLNKEVIYSHTFFLECMHEFKMKIFSSINNDLGFPCIQPIILIDVLLKHIK
jgi:hypothetical protein